MIWSKTQLYSRIISDYFIKKNKRLEEVGGTAYYRPIGVIVSDDVQLLEEIRQMQFAGGASSQTIDYTMRVNHPHDGSHLFLLSTAQYEAYPWNWEVEHPNFWIIECDIDNETDFSAVSYLPWEGVYFLSSPRLIGCEIGMKKHLSWENVWRSRRKKKVIG